MASTRPYKVGVLGATGFTGQIIVRTLASRYGGQVPWVMAARSPSKLQEVRDKISTTSPSVSDGALLTVDVAKPDTLDELTSQCNALINTVGPFSKHGTPVVEACLRNGCHYVDLTGELQWMRKMILQHHEAAESAGIKIVHSGGFDSIPSDMTTWLAAKSLNDKGCTSVDTAYTLYLAMVGGVSGGTVETSKYALQQDVSDPYLLLPPDWPRGVDVIGEQQGAGYNEIFQAHTVPFPFSTVDTRVVRRSSAILGYGAKLSVSGGFKVPDRNTAVAIDAILAASRAVESFEPARQLASLISVPDILGWFIPPGEGPPQWLQDRGYSTVKTAAKGMRDTGSNAVTSTAVFSVEKADPGYKGTAAMIVEAGLALAEGENEQFGSCPVVNGGVLTPASALGGALVRRIDNLPNFTLRVED